VDIPVGLWTEGWNFIPEVPIRNLSIHAHDYHGPFNLTDLYKLNDHLKNGDHLFGIVFASCEECDRIRYYWVFYERGGSGWYADAADEWGSQLVNLPPEIKFRGLAASVDYLVPGKLRLPLVEKSFTMR